jgi:hypothetical protein
MAVNVMENSDEAPRVVGSQGKVVTISAPVLWLTIEIDDETWDVLRFRRNYLCCPQGCGRSGTVILASPWPRTDMRTVIVCEKCARRWRPSTGAALRALGR